ncbi:MAG: hypothetical protein ABI629_00315 [bacterium]
MFATWHELYASDAQSAWAPLVMPALYLLWRGVRGAPRGAGVLPAARSFVDAYGLVFACETLVDPLATGPLLRVLGFGDGGSTAVTLLFVLLGDFRVYLLMFGLLSIAAGRSWRSALPRAAGWTLLVPLIAYPTNALVTRLNAGWSASGIWLIYEVTFCAVALALRGNATHVAPPALRAYLRAVLLYVAVYYGLWATSDVCSQLAGLDVGWLLRVLPNQLYYGLWIPFVVWRFIAPRYCATSASTQASR